MSTSQTRPVRWAEAVITFSFPRIFELKTFFQGLPGTKNFYLETDSGVQVGVWQILPLTLVEDSEGKELDWWDTQLSDGRCIYLA